MGSRQSASPFWTILTLLGLAGFGFLGLLIAGQKFNVGPLAPEATATPTATPVPTPLPRSRVTVLDYGRFTTPVEVFHIDEPAGVLILYIDTSGMTASSEYLEAMASLDEVAALVVEPGDVWAYYFDTLSDGSLYVIFRCPVDDIGLPAAERGWQSAMVSSGVSAGVLYDLGFVSSR